MSMDFSNVRAVYDDDGAVLMNLESDTRSTLNATASFVWQRLVSGLPKEQIVAELALHTSADQKEIMRDVDDLLDDLKLKGHLKESARG